MQAVFVRVLNLSVSAGYVILAVMAMRLILRRAPRWAVCALWALAAFRLCCPFTLESALSLLPSRETVNESALLERDSAAPLIQSGFELIDRRANQAIAGLSTAAPIERPEAAPAEQTQPAPAAEASAPIIDVMEALSWAWLTGMALMLLYGAGSYIFLRRRLATAVRWKDELWQSENVDAPFVLGIFRPRVYLPFAMDGPAFEQVIAHERAHIRRHDQVTKLLAWLILSVYWFDPLCWTAYWLLGRDIELACDERVIRDLDENQRKGYARALLAWGVTRPKLNACPVAFGEAGLKERIIKVMRYKKPALWAMALAVMLCAGAAVCLLTVPMAEAAGDSEPAPEAVTVTSAPYEAKAAETAAPADEPAETAPSEDGAIKALTDRGIDVWQPEGPVYILHVLPRLFEPEQVQTIAETLFGGGEAYEGEPGENGGDVPAQWRYQPVDGVDGTVPYQQMKVRLVRDSGETIVSASSYSPSDGVPANILYITNIVYDSTAGKAPAQEADIAKEAERYLDELGLEGWFISSIDMAETADATVTVCARPSYDGLPLIDASGLLEQYEPSADTADAYMDEHILFSFTSSGQLCQLEWVDPVQITGRMETEYLRSPEEVLALIAEDETDALGPDAAPEDVAAYLHDSGVVSMHLGYLRIALDTAATDVRMVPYWFFLDGDGQACRLTLAGSAEDIQAPEGWDADDETLRDAASQPAPEGTLAICWSGRPGYDYNGTGFWAAAGDSFDMDVEDTADTPVWSSDNEAVATVDQDGVVTLLAPGDANITVQAGGLTGVCPVHVASY